MAATTDTVSGRIERARIELTPVQVATGLAIVVVLGAGLMFLQEPAVHDSLHNFRHVAGVTCH